MTGGKLLRTKKIQDINIESSDWEDGIYLTFDLDWAADFVISDTLDLLDKFDVSATFFATHETPILKRIQENPKYEVGIHPNFNNLLTSTRNEESNSKSIMRSMKEIVPEAVSMRSHSTTNSSKILEISKELGITHDCNYLIPYQAEISLKPWLLWNGMIRCPYFFEDDVSLEYGANEESMKFLLEKSGLKIFDFHPIHVFLNTDSLKLYERTRNNHNDLSTLVNFRSTNRGTRIKFLEILELTRD